MGRDWRPHKVFVTGGTGFIGRNLVGSLVDRGIPVSALVRRTKPQVLSADLQVEGDILDAKRLVRQLEGHDTVYHCAAKISFHVRDYLPSYSVNVEGTRNVLTACLQAGISKVIHLSACAVLGFTDHPDRTIDESANPEFSKDNVYAHTKALAEKEVLMSAAQGLNVSIANISTVYGFGDHRLNSGAMIRMIYRGGFRLIPPGGTSYVTIADLVKGLFAVAQYGQPGQRYILSNENLTYQDLVRRIAAVMGISRSRFVLPRIARTPLTAAARLVESVSSGNAVHVGLLTRQIVREMFAYKYFSNKKAKQDLDWSPKSTLEQAVLSALEYYSENHLL